MANANRLRLRVRYWFENNFVRILYFSLHFWIDFCSVFSEYYKTDDSDAEHDVDTKTDEDKSETNGDSAVDSADNGDAAAGDEEEGYEVEDIVDHKIKGKKKFFKIRWKNYDESQDTWENEEDLSCPEIIERYLEKHPEAAVAVKKTPKKVSKFSTKHTKMAVRFRRFLFHLYTTIWLFHLRFNCICSSLVRLSKFFDTCTEQWNKHAHVYTEFGTTIKLFDETNTYEVEPITEQSNTCT